MNIKTVSEKLFDYLVKNLPGDRFESLAKGISAAEAGEEFVPLGGMHDGGADAFLDMRVFEGKKPGAFF